jgi:hypothetical protein
MLALRAIARYDPSADFADRYPDWTLFVSDLPEGIGEVFLPGRLTVLVSRTVHEKDADYAVAHVTAHMDLDHPIGGPFSHDEEMQARFLAQVRLDSADIRNDPMCQLRLPKSTPAADAGPTRSNFEV